MYSKDMMKVKVAIAACDVAGHTVSRDVQTISNSTTDTATQTDLVHLVYLQPQGLEKSYQALRLNQGGAVELATAENLELLNCELKEHSNLPITEGTVTEGVDANNPQWQELTLAVVVIMLEVTEEMAKVQTEDEIFQASIIQQYPMMAALMQADLSEPPIERYVGLEQIHVEARHLFRDVNEPARYPAIVNRKRVLLTAPEYSVHYPNHKLLYTDETRDRKKVRAQIKRRISVHFHDWENQNLDA